MKGEAAMAVKVTGKRGSWYADAGGEKLAVVHERWWNVKEKKYSDPGFDASSDYWTDFAAHINQTQKVIVKKSEWNDGERRGPWSRDLVALRHNGYAGIFSVGPVSKSTGSLEFEFLARLDDAM